MYVGQTGRKFVQKEVTGVVIEKISPNAPNSRLEGKLLGE
jgi:hypothetical protein